MGARTLGARLTARFLAVAAASLILVAVAAVVFTHLALDRADSSLARFRAEALHAALLRELSEGDSLDEAGRELLTQAHAENLRMSLSKGGKPVLTEAPIDVALGTCATLEDESGAWRACSTGAGDYVVIAAVPIEAHRQTVHMLGVSMLAIVILTLGALVLSVRRALASPLQEVSDLVAWTATAGDETRPRPPAETAELSDLGAAFEDLVARLISAAERERATSAHIAHELRTPLATLLAEMDSAPRDGDAMRLPITAREDIVRLSEVIDAILVVSDRHAKRSTVIINVADIARELAGDDIRVQAPDEALTTGDHRLIVLALKNLIENATKHAGGAKEIHVTRDGNAIRLSVVDQGPGVDEVGRTKMFDRYWRGVADGSGKGLGLALVRVVADLHDGRADARSTRYRGLDVGFTMSGVERWH